MGRELSRKLAKKAKAMQRGLKQPKSNFKTIQGADPCTMPSPDLFDYSDKVIEWDLNMIEDKPQEVIERMRQISLAARSNIYRGSGWSSQRLANLLGLTGKDGQEIVKIELE